MCQELKCVSSCIEAAFLFKVYLDLLSAYVPIYTLLRTVITLIVIGLMKCANLSELNRDNKIYSVLYLLQVVIISIYD